MYNKLWKIGSLMCAFLFLPSCICIYYLFLCISYHTYNVYSRHYSEDKQTHTDKQLEVTCAKCVIAWDMLRMYVRNCLRHVTYVCAVTHFFIWNPSKTRLDPREEQLPSSQAVPTSSVSRNLTPSWPLHRRASFTLVHTEVVLDEDEEVMIFLCGEASAVITTTKENLSTGTPSSIDSRPLTWITCLLLIIYEHTSLCGPFRRVRVEKSHAISRALRPVRNVGQLLTIGPWHELRSVYVKAQPALLLTSAQMSPNNYERREVVTEESCTCTARYLSSIGRHARWNSKWSCNVCFKRSRIAQRSANWKIHQLSE